MSIIYNMAGTESYNTTLNNMSELSDLTDYIKKVADGKKDNTNAILNLIAEMSKKIQSVKDKVDNIHAGSLKIGSRIKELIAESDNKQKKKLVEIKKSIELLGEVNDINDSVNGLNGIVSELLNKVDGPGPGSGSGSGPGSGSGSGSGPGSGPGSGSGSGSGPGSGDGSGATPAVAATTVATTAATGNVGTKGGYTYGKSKKRGKGRRKRTKKSRKKGSNKK
jgi:hypothetical protein